MTAKPLLIVVAAGLGLLVVSGLQYQANEVRREANQTLEGQAAQLAEIAPERAPRPALTPPAEEQPGTERRTELGRLRSQAAELKGQFEALAAQRAAERAEWEQTRVRLAAEAEVFKLELEAKMMRYQHWTEAFLHYTQESKGKFPADFARLRELLPPETREETDHMAGNFKFVVQGSLPAAGSDGRCILLQQLAPFQTPAQGAWLKFYILTDGEVTVQSARDGNFSAWENEHQPPSQSGSP